MAAGPIQQGEPLPRLVTSSGRRPGTPAAERKRLQREREKQLVYATEDWRLFFDPVTLPQKAGCHPQHLCALVLKELVDNALDDGTNVHLDVTNGTWVIADDGPGLDPVDVPRLFCVNRPLLSSKLKRLPKRGMLGNGLRVVTGAVAALEGSLMVETRGHRLILKPNRETGLTDVVADEAIPVRAGLIVLLSLGSPDAATEALGRDAIAIAAHGTAYSGPSSPWWYGPSDLHKLFEQITPPHTTVGAICGNLGFAFDDDRIARTLTRADAAALLSNLRSINAPIAPEKLGFIGKTYLPNWPGYARISEVTTTQAGAQIPFVAEAWASCTRPTHRGLGGVSIRTAINRSPTLAILHARSWPKELALEGCGLKRRVAGPPTGDYEIQLSIITPYIQLATDGKEPSLLPFSTAIAEVLRKACGAAHRAMSRPERGTTVKEAAWAVMEDAYLKASGDGRYPANARQVMYAARPDILELTGADKLDDAYFTQVLLPDYIAEAGAEWDVVYDARGGFIEPHTQHEVRLGTIGVRDYLNGRPDLGPLEHGGGIGLYPTVGPENRYSAVLFIEKEGFTPLLEAARIAERFDIAIMSTKGMSTTAARRLLDKLAPSIQKVLVLHDFDVSGFSIFGTLSSDGRRYQFEHELPVVDLGLRLSDVSELDLQSEPVETNGNWEKRSRTLAEHGATPQEIAFLATRRVELNAMPADVFVELLERKLAAHGIAKLVPSATIIEAHARRVVERQLANDLILANVDNLRAQAWEHELPDDLAASVRAVLQQRTDLSWDRAVELALKSSAS